MPCCAPPGTRRGCVFCSCSGRPELTVTELTDILGQSQPRVSRHLKLLCDAGLIERFKEGSWVFYRAADTGRGGALGQVLSTLSAEEPSVPEADLKRLGTVREERAAEAAAYFKANAAEWERIRALHAPDKDVEAAIVRHIARASRSRISSMPVPARGGCLNCCRRM